MYGVSSLSVLLNLLIIKPAPTEEEEKKEAISNAGKVLCVRGGLTDKRTAPNRTHQSMKLRLVIENSLVIIVSLAISLGLFKYSQTLGGGEKLKLLKFQYFSIFRDSENLITEVSKVMKIFESPFIIPVSKYVYFETFKNIMSILIFVKLSSFYFIRNTLCNVSTVCKH